MKELLTQQRDTAQRLGITQTKEVAQKNYGPTKPSIWPNNLPFFDQTNGLWVYFDGARWLTVQEYTLDLYERATLAAGVSHDRIARDNFTSYYTRLLITTSVATTNNGANFWSVFVQGLNLAIGATTTIVQVNTNGDTVGVNTSHSGIALTTNLPANNTYVRLIAAVGAGAPGVLTLAAAVVFRLVIP